MDQKRYPTKCRENERRFAMRNHVFHLVMSRPTTILLVFLVLALLLVGGVGEAVAHNPAGIGVPGCENGADVVAHENPNCHG